MIDFEKWLRSVVKIKNEGGSRAYGQGIRTYDCPLCRDRKARGWMGLRVGAVGCMNAGCDADPKLEGGAVEMYRRLEHLPTRSVAFAKMFALYGTEGAATAPPPKPFSGEDFVRWPAGVRLLEPGGSHMQVAFTVFALAQWGVREADLREWGCRWAIEGEVAWRLLIPIRMGGRDVGWQARGIRGDARPKYVTSRYGPSADPRSQCGRPAAAMLFNADSLVDGGEVLVVEGVGDVMRWHRGDRARQPTAVAILGTALTPEKLAVIASRHPTRASVGLDVDPAAQARARDYAERLEAWDVPVDIVRWVGGKDAGSGAEMVATPEDWSGVDSVRARLGR